MPSLVWVVILVLDPDLGFTPVANAVSRHIIDLGAEEANQLRSREGGNAGKPVIKTDNDEATRFRFAHDGLEGPPRIPSVMQHASTHDDIERLILHAELEDIHLNERRAG